MHMEEKVGYWEHQCALYYGQADCAQSSVPPTYLVTLLILLLNLILFSLQYLCHFGFFEVIIIFFLQLDLLLSILRCDRVESDQTLGSMFKGPSLFTEISLRPFRPPESAPVTSFSLRGALNPPTPSLP